MNRVKTVLLVDGDLTFLVANSERLQSEGFHVQTAEDGGEALFHLAALRIDVVVMDLVLPTLSGIEVFKRMREDERLREMPVVILSDAPADKRPRDLRGPTQFLLKSETQFPALLQTIQDLSQAAVISGFSGLSFDTTFSHVAGNVAVADAAPAIAATAGLSSKTLGAKKAATFFEELTAELPKIREDCFAYLKAPSKPAGKRHLSILCEHLYSWDARSHTAGFARVSLLAKPFHALLAGILAKSNDPSPSILQTIAQGLDCLTMLLDSGENEVFESMLRPQVLVVDDDPVSNEVNSTALQEADFDVTNLEDPFTALELLAGTPFDLIVLDVNMPQLSGFELCEKLRRLPESKATPVLFLTAFSNFENRKKSVLSGGGDFITKPVSTRELALKAAIHLLKSIVRTPQTKTVREIQKSAGSPAQRPLPASALTSATESATSSLEGPDHRAAAPSKAKSDASQNPATKNDVAPAVDARHTERTVKTNGKKDANLRMPKAGDLKQATSISAPKKTNPALSNEWPPPLDMLANSEIERATGSDLTRNGDNGLKETRGSIETTVATSQPQNASEKVAQCKQLEQELAGLLKSCAELQGKLANGEGATLKSQNEISELKERLSQKAATLEVIKAEFAKDSTTHVRLESELREVREQLKQAQAAVKEKDENYRLLEAELIPLRKFRDQLQQKQQQSATELARVKGGFAQETAERAKSESELRLQLTAAKLAASEAERARKEKEENYKLLEEELAPLRRVREQFQEKQRQITTELEHSKAELIKATAERAKSESELQEQLKGVKQELTQTEAALYRARDLEKQMTALRKEHEHLQAQQKQTASELERSKAELTQASAERAKSETEMRKQLEAAERVVTETEAALKENRNCVRDLEKQGTTLRKEHELLQAQQKQTATELERSQAEATQESADHAKMETELRVKLNAANLTVTQTEAALKESGKCTRDLEAQLSALRKENENLQGRQQQTAAELEQRKTELTQASAERAKSESELSKRLEASALANSQTQAALKEKDASCRTLREALSTLRQAHSQLEHQSTADLKKVKGELKEQTSERSRLETECTNLLSTKKALSLELSRLRESLAASEAKTCEVEKSIKDGLASLASVTTELEKERGARQRVEERAESLASYLRGLYGDLEKELAKEQL
jgi:DNA-binding response OmpR family regulator